MDEAFYRVGGGHMGYFNFEIISEGKFLPRVRMKYEFKEEAVNHEIGMVSARWIGTVRRGDVQ